MNWCNLLNLSVQSTWYGQPASNDYFFFFFYQRFCPLFSQLIDWVCSMKCRNVVKHASSLWILLLFPTLHFAALLLAKNNLPHFHEVVTVTVWVRSCCSEIRAVNFIFLSDVIKNGLGCSLVSWIFTLISFISSISLYYAALLFHLLNLIWPIDE